MFCLQFFKVYICLLYFLFSVRQEPRNKVLVRQPMVKQQPLEFNTYNTECITDFNTELAIPLGKELNALKNRTSLV